MSRRKGKTRRPELTPVPLAEVWPPVLGLAYVTMSPGQWDGLLEAAYAVGFVLLEVDGRDRPVAAYRLASDRN